MNEWPRLKDNTLSENDIKDPYVFFFLWLTEVEFIYCNGRIWSTIDLIDGSNENTRMA